MLDECHFEAAYLIPGVEFVEPHSDSVITEQWLKFIDLRDMNKGHTERRVESLRPRLREPFRHESLPQVDLGKSSPAWMIWNPTTSSCRRRVCRRHPEILLDDTCLRVIICTASLGIDELQATLEASRGAANIRIFLTGTFPSAANP